MTKKLLMVSTTHERRIDGPSVEKLPVRIHTEHTRLSNAPLVFFDLGMDLVEAGVGGIFAS